MKTVFRLISRRFDNLSLRSLVLQAIRALFLLDCRVSHDDIIAWQRIGAARDAGNGSAIYPRALLFFFLSYPEIRSVEICTDDNDGSNENDDSLDLQFGFVGTQARLAFTKANTRYRRDMKSSQTSEL